MSDRRTGQILAVTHLIYLSFIPAKKIRKQTCSYFPGINIVEWHIWVLFWNILHCLPPFPLISLDHIFIQDPTLRLLQCIVKMIVVGPWAALDQCLCSKLSFFFFFEDGSWTKTVQLWQSKLCCLTVGVLALSPTRTVCLANKKENVFIFDVLPSASKKNTMNVVSKALMAQRGKIIQYPDE